MSQQRSKRNRTLKLKVQSMPQQLQHINVNAAGIDIGAEQHMVAVPEGRDEVTVRRFGTFTADLVTLADWLAHCGITTVAMESTGVYWIPLFELLEGRGFEVRSTRDTSRTFPVASPTCSIVNGCSSYTLTDYSREPFGRRMKSVCCAVTCGKKRCSSRQRRSTFSTCKRRCNK